MRDRSILLTLLDTGARASELIALDVSDFDLVTGALTIRRGKGGKGRAVFLGQKARRAVRAYLAVNADELPSQSFAATVKVDVEDIFGRQATAVRVLMGSKSYGQPGPGLEMAVDIDEVALELHGPGPVAQPIDQAPLMVQLRARLAHLEARLAQIERG